MLAPPVKKQRSTNTPNTKGGRGGVSGAKMSGYSKESGTAGTQQPVSNRPNYSSMPSESTIKTSNSVRTTDNQTSPNSPGRMDALVDKAIAKRRVELRRLQDKIKSGASSASSGLATIAVRGPAGLKSKLVTSMHLQALAKSNASQQSPNVSNTNEKAVAESEKVSNKDGEESDKSRVNDSRLVGRSEGLGKGALYAPRQSQGEKLVGSAMPAAIGSVLDSSDSGKLRKGKVPDLLSETNELKANNGQELGSLVESGIAGLSTRPLNVKSARTPAEMYRHGSALSASMDGQDMGTMNDLVAGSSPGENAYASVTPARPRRLDLSATASIGSFCERSTTSSLEANASLSSPTLLEDDDRFGDVKSFLGGTKIPSGESTASSSDPANSAVNKIYPLSPNDVGGGASMGIIGEARGGATNIDSLPPSPDTPMTDNTGRQATSLPYIAPYFALSSSPSLSPIHAARQSPRFQSGPDTENVLRRADRVLDKNIRSPRSNASSKTENDSVDDVKNDGHNKKGFLQTVCKYAEEATDVMQKTANRAAADAAMGKNISSTRRTASANGGPFVSLTPRSLTGSNVTENSITDVSSLRENNQRTLVSELGDTMKELTRALQRVAQLENELHAYEIASDVSGIANVKSTFSEGQVTSEISRRKDSKRSGSVMVLSPAKSGGGSKKRARVATPGVKQKTDVSEDEGTTFDVMSGEQRKYFVERARKVISSRFSSSIALYEVTFPIHEDKERERLEVDNVLSAVVHLLIDDGNDSDDHGDVVDNTQNRGIGSIVDILGVNAIIRADHSTLQIPPKSLIVQHCKKPGTQRNGDVLGTQLYNVFAGTCVEERADSGNGVKSPRELPTLGIITYIDSCGMESEYDLSLVYDEAVAVRNNYVCSLVNAAWALSQEAHCRGRNTSNVDFEHNMMTAQPPAYHQQNLPTPQVLSEMGLKNAMVDASVSTEDRELRKDVGVQIDLMPASVPVESEPSIVDSTAHAGLSTQAFHGREARQDGEESTKYSSHAVVQNDYENSSDILSNMIIFVFKMCFKVLRIVLVTCPCMAARFVIRIGCIGACLALLWLVLADDSGLRLWSLNSGGRKTVLDQYHGDIF